MEPFSLKQNPISELYNMNCIDGMRHYPDKYFDLAICDPPYGIGLVKRKYTTITYTSSMSTCGTNGGNMKSCWITKHGLVKPLRTLIRE